MLMAPEVIKQTNRVHRLPKKLMMKGILKAGISTNAAKTKDRCMLLPKLEVLLA